MDIIKMMEEFPKTGELIRQGIKTFVKELQMQMMEEVGVVDDDLPPVADEEVNDFLQATMNNPDSMNMLIEIFDAQKVYVIPTYSGLHWRCEIYTGEELAEDISGVQDSRKEAYRIGFPHAFKLLEEQLNNQKE